jgi:hypothetical protein
MTEMIERIAGAIGKGLDGDLKVSGYSAVGLVYGLSFAAVMKMRDPTDDMVAAFNKALMETKGGVRGAWAAAIDVALGFSPPDAALVSEEGKG